MVNSITIIEDDFRLLDLFETIFEEDYNIKLYSDYEKALYAIKANPPTLVLTDLMFGSLPAGFEIIQHLRNDPTTFHIPIILCSADTHALKIHRAYLTDLKVRTLAKPFDLTNLLRIVTELTANS